METASRVNFEGDFRAGSNGRSHDDSGPKPHMKCDFFPFPEREEIFPGIEDGESLFRNEPYPETGDMIHSPITEYGESVGGNSNDFLSPSEESGGKFWRGDGDV